MIKKTALLSTRLGCILLLSALLAACGYSLRAPVQLPQQLRSLNLQTFNLKNQAENSELSRLLKRSLKSSGVHVLSDPDQSFYTLQISREKNSRRTVSIDSRAKASEYELHMEVSYQLGNQDKVLLGPETLFIEKIYLEDVDNIVGKSEEVKILKNEMRKELIAQLLLRLRALSI